MEKRDIKSLKRRYLVWFYKTAKEALDKVERKFTQVEIDKFILDLLKKQDKDKEIAQFRADFADYIRKKQDDGLALKFEGGKLKPEYRFLVLRLRAVEKAIVKELGKKALTQIKSLYEEEMTQRILKSTEH